MSYFRSAGKGLRQDRDARSLGSAMQQGDQPKHASGTDLGTAMRQGRTSHGDAGSCYEQLGGVMKQGNGGKRGR